MEANQPVAASTEASSAEDTVVHTTEASHSTPQSQPDPSDELAPLMDSLLASPRPSSGVNYVIQDPLLASGLTARQHSRDPLGLGLFTDMSFGSDLLGLDSLPDLFGSPLSLSAIDFGIPPKTPCGSPADSLHSVEPILPINQDQTFKVPLPPSEKRVRGKKPSKKKDSCSILRKAPATESYSSLLLKPKPMPRLAPVSHPTASTIRLFEAALAESDVASPKPKKKRQLSEKRKLQRNKVRTERRKQNPPLSRKVYQLNKGQLELQHMAWEKMTDARDLMADAREAGKPGVLDNDARDVIADANADIFVVGHRLNKLASLTDHKPIKASDFRFKTLASDSERMTFVPRKQENKTAKQSYACFRRRLALFLILLLVGDEMVVPVATHVMDIEQRQAAAAYGIEVNPVGELYPFAHSWIHTFVVRNPTAQDYSDFLNSMKSQCNATFNHESMSENVTMDGRNDTMTVAEVFAERCNAFVSALITETRQLIDETFTTDLPQPHNERVAKVDAGIHARAPVIITGGRERDFIDMRGRRLGHRENIPLVDDEISVYQKLAAFELEYAHYYYDYFISENKPCPDVTPLQVFWEQQDHNLTQTAVKARSEIALCMAGLRATTPPRPRPSWVYELFGRRTTPMPPASNIGNRTYDMKFLKEDAASVTTWRTPARPFTTTRSPSGRRTTHYGTRPASSSLNGTSTRKPPAAVQSHSATSSIQSKQQHPIAARPGAPPKPTVVTSTAVTSREHRGPVPRISSRPSRMHRRDVSDIDSLAFDQPLSRIKRFDPITWLFIGLGILILAVYTGVAVDLHLRVAALNEKIRQVGVSLEKTLSAEKAMLSINDLRGETLDDTIVAIREIKQVQRIFQRYINQLTNDTYALQRQSFDNLLAVNLIQQLELTQRAREVTNSLRMHIQRHVTGIETLKSGYLPSQLISFSTLRNVLHDITKELPQDVELGIHESDIARYYTLPLASYSAEKDHTQIHLAIPLRRRDSTDMLTLYKPSFHVFPIPRQWAVADDRSSDDLVQVALPNEYWAFNKRVFVGTLLHDDMSCRATGAHLTCMSFNARLLHSHDRCRILIIHQNLSNIHRECEFHASDSRDYMPIYLGNGSYMVHSRRDFEYTVDCPRDLVPRQSVRVVDRWQIIDVKPTCTLTLFSENQQTPLVRGGDYMQMSSSPVDPFQGAYPDYVNGVRIRRPKTKRAIEPLDIVHDVTITDNSKAIRKLQEGMQQDIAVATQIAQGLASGLSKGDIPIMHTAWSAVRTAATTLLDLLIIFVAASSICNGRWLLWTPSVVVLAPVVDALDIDLNPLSYVPTSLNPLFASGLTNMLSSLKIALLMIGLLLLIMRTAFYKIELADYTALERRSKPQRFWIEFTFVYERRGVFSSRQAHVSILIPIPEKAPFDTVSVMCMKGSNLYYFSENCFCLAEPLTIRGVYNDGTFSFSGDLTVSIPWSDLRWKYNHKPTDIQKGQCGLASVRAVPDPRII